MSRPKEAVLTPLSCPFCGGSPTLTHWRDDKWTLGCEECPTRPMTPHLLNPKTAIEAWNTRCLAKKIFEKNMVISSAAVKFLKRLDELMTHINSDRAFALNHGIDWPHGNWKKERNALDLAINPDRAETKNDVSAV